VTVCSISCENSWFSGAYTRHVLPVLL